MAKSETKAKRDKRTWRSRLNPFEGEPDAVRPAPGKVTAMRVAFITSRILGEAKAKGRALDDADEQGVLIRAQAGDAGIASDEDGEKIADSFTRSICDAMAIGGNLTTGVYAAFLIGLETGRACERERIFCDATGAEEEDAKVEAAEKQAKDEDKPEVEVGSVPTPRNEKPL